MALCDTSVLTGQEGLVQFKPPGTTVCLDDYCSFSCTDNRIYLPCDADFRVGECVVFDENGGGNLPSAITVETQYYVKESGKAEAGDVNACGQPTEGSKYIVLATDEALQNELSFACDGGSDTRDGSINTTSINAAGTGGVDGTYENVPLVTTSAQGSGAYGTVVISGGEVSSITITYGGEGYVAGTIITMPAGYANAAGTKPFNNLVGEQIEITAVANAQQESTESAHVTMTLCEFQTVCQVRSFSLDLSRDELDTTTLPCDASEIACDGIATFRTTQAGFATATGTMEVYFTCDQTSTGNRLLGSSLAKSQQGATVRLYVCTQVNPDGTIDDTSSIYFEATVNLLGMSFSVDPDNPTTATINFGVTKVTHAFQSDV